MGQVIKLARSTIIRRQLKDIEQSGVPLYLETEIGHRFARMLVCWDDHFEFTNTNGERVAFDYDMVIRCSSSPATIRKGAVVSFQRRRLSKRLIPIQSDHSDQSA
jgi:hypothetical protein